MLRVYTKPGCVICEIVSLAIKDVALNFGLTLHYFGEHPDIPAYPAVLVKDHMFIGEFAAKEARLFLEGILSLPRQNQDPSYIG